MPELSQRHSSRVVMFPNQPTLNSESPRTKTRRKHSENATFTISREVIADRLRCMQQHVQSSDATQVLLHALALTAVLTPASDRAELIRDLIQEAHGLFARGACRRAEQRLQEALRLC